jgi:hypothetical protein
MLLNHREALFSVLEPLITRYLLLGVGGGGGQKYDFLKAVKILQSEKLVNETIDLFHCL